MTGQELKILFRKDKAYLTLDCPLMFKQLQGLPSYIQVFESPAYWTIRVINYDERQKKIYCEIISYNNGDTVFDENQILYSDELKEVQLITFKSIDTAGLLKTSINSKPTKIKLNQFDKDTFLELTKVTVKETFYISFKKISFIDGNVIFEKKFKEHDKTFKLAIPNINIKKEFEPVKNYFSNVLKIKKIQVTVNLEIKNNEITFQDIRSAEVAKIDGQLIDEVKISFVKQMIKDKTHNESGKVSYTIDEYFDTYSKNEVKSTLFYNDEKELLGDLIKITNTKHYKHLNFLSGRHSHKTMKLRFILNPFSFLFLIRGEKKYYFVWETLNTEEATYIWSSDEKSNALKNDLKKVEDTIYTIKTNGKFEYIKLKDELFKRVFHDYSEQNEGYAKWEEDMKNILV